MERTLTIDDDVLEAAEKLATQQKTSVDRIISELSRKGLAFGPKLRFSAEDLPTLPARDMTPVTLEFVNELRDRIGD